MQIAMVGLGKMGLNMAKRLMQGGHEVVGHSVVAAEVQAAVDAGAVGAATPQQVVEKLSAPRHVWMMVPAGDITESVFNTFLDLLEAGDTLIDGGNSNYKDTLRRAETAQAKGVHFVDVGTSGGVWGLAEGYSMMVGGTGEAVERLRPALETLAPSANKGWGHVGASGTGHFVKMVHNGIEYGLMQAYAEGFEIMAAKQDFNLDMHQIAEIWRHGSVVRSWLLDLTADALAEDQTLSHIKGYVTDSGEGRWTVFDAIDLDVPAPIITLALQMRFISRQDESYAAKIVAAQRNQFGGHTVKKADE